MASKEQARATSPTNYYHAMLRPTILQILRAQKYYGCSPAVADAVTDLACRYMAGLAKSIASHAETHNENPKEVTIVDLRMALEDFGALVPTMDPVAEQWTEEEDIKGVENFVRWAKGPKNVRISKMAKALQQAVMLEGTGDEADPPVMVDYLSVMKKKHNKTDMDSKYAGTVLGKGLDHGEVLIEGGPATSIHDWMQQQRESLQRPTEPSPDSRPPSSGLSSLTDGDVEMMDLA